MRCGRFLIVLLAVPAFAQAQRKEFDEARQLKDVGRIEEAELLANRLLDEAVRNGKPAEEAEARRTIALLRMRQARFAEARTQLDRGLEAARKQGDRVAAGRVWMDYGFLESLAGDSRQEREAYRAALTEFDVAGSPSDKAAALYMLAGLAGDPAEKKRLTDQGLEVARTAGDRAAEARLQLIRSDVLLGEGEPGEALAEAERAAAWFEREGRQEDLARATSRLARVYRAQGQNKKALEENLRGLAAVEKSGNAVAIAQALDAVSVAYSRTGRNRNTIDYAERALAMAKKSGSPNLIQRQLLGLGASLNAAGEFARAAKTIEEAMAAGAPAKSIPWRNLANAYRMTGDPRALDTADRAVEAGRQSPYSNLADSLRIRAVIRKEKGDLEGSLRDIEEGIELIERRRGRSIQTDEMKRAYAAETFRLFSLAVEVLHQLGRHAEAAAKAEQARGRAFADLMATREAELKSKVSAEAGVQGAAVRETTGARRQQLPGPALRSFVSAAPASAAEMAATAARLRSTLVMYWHNIYSTYIWVAKTDGRVEGVRVEVTRDRLNKLIAEAGAAENQAAARGEPEVATRGGGTLQVRVSNKNAFRELNRLLIEPVRHLLPPEDGSLLTIVPHGPLFQVSFAALLDDKGRYLVERHRLHYVPSAGVLDFTKGKSGANRRKTFLLVADPSGMASSDGKPLPALPGTRKEVRAIAGMAGGGVTVLAGPEAGEDRVRAAAGGKDVVHFATHGVVRQDDPGQSFLAMARSGRAAGDGQLTANEVYGLELDADLVVLSACRSARGGISVDGVAGLTRAFFYAGTPSVVATMWDVADEPTTRLVTRFYQRYVRGGGKSEALRQAQLQLIGDLRNGRVRVETPLGPVTLPEHPSFWAGFVLAGEP